MDLGGKRERTRLSWPKDPLGAVYKDIYGFDSIYSVNEHRRKSLLILAYGREFEESESRHMWFVARIKKTNNNNYLYYLIIMQIAT